MKLTTIAFVTAFALPSTFAFAEGSMNYSAPAARPVVRGVTVTRPVAIRPQNLFGDTPAQIMHDPGGLTFSPSAWSRGG
jgi:hypothetical protein